MPEEFAAAYQAAYEQALAELDVTPQPRDDADRGTTVVVDDGAASDAQAGDASPTWFERLRDTPWFVPVLLGLLVLLLILGAYAVGKALAGQVGTESPGAEPSVLIGTGGSARQPITNQKPGPGAWGGKVTRLKVLKATASCTSKAGVDAGGSEVSYAAANLVDGTADTTWRCPGRAIGETITLKLGQEVAIGQVGLIPGYAKTDEKSKADRYAENNRITRLRWTLGDKVVVQKMDGSPTDRSLQLLRVPKTTTDTVMLEIRAVTTGPRKTTAISEIQLGRAG